MTFRCDLRIHATWGKLKEKCSDEIFSACIQHVLQPLNTFLFLFATSYADRSTAHFYAESKKATLDRWMAWEACSHLHRILMLFSILVFNNQHKSCINLNMPNQLSLHSIWTDDCWFTLCRPYCFHHSRAKFRRNEQVCFCCHTNQRPEKLLNKTFCHVFVYQFHNFILFCFISTRINVTQPNKILS